MPPCSLHVSQQVLDPLVRLLPAREDLASRQHKSVPTSIAKLDGEDIVCLGDIADVVHTAARDLVYSTADRPRLELRAKQRLHGPRSAFCEFLVLVVLGRQRGARVSVGRHKELRVRVPVNVQLQALRGPDGV